MTETSTAAERAVPGLEALRRAERRRPGQERIDRTMAARARSARPSAVRRVFGGSPVGSAEREAFDAARGERIVGRELDALPTEWVVLHSLTSPGGSGDLDHVVVGPGGLFAVTTRFVVGDRVVVAEDHLLTGGWSMPFARASASATRRTAQLASRSLPPAVVPRGVVIVAGAHGVRVGARSRSVEVHDVRRVRDWLGSLPPVLDAASVERVAARIAAAFEAERGGGTVLEPSSDVSVRASLFARLERDNRLAGRVRVIWRAAGVAALAAGVWVSFTLVPAWLASHLG